MTTIVQFTVYLDQHGSYHQGDEYKPFIGNVCGYCQQQVLNINNEKELIPVAVVAVYDKTQKQFETFVVPVHELEIKRL